MSFSLGNEMSDALWDTGGWLVPLAVLLALAGVLVDALRGSRPMPRFLGFVARLVLGLLLLALAAALYLMASAVSEAVRNPTEISLVTIAAFILLALGMGLFAWFFLLRAARRREPADRRPPADLEGHGQYPGWPPAGSPTGAAGSRPARSR